MTLFVILAALLAAAGLAFLLPPLLRGGGNRADIDRARANLGILKDQLAELEAEHARGNVDAAQYGETRAELERRVIEDAQATAAAPLASAPIGGRALAITLGIVLPVAAGLVYTRLGDPAALNPALQATAQQDPHGAGGQVDEMVKALRARLEKEPDNANGWSTLARTYYQMRKFPEAAAAYEKLVALVPDEAAVLADYADAAAMAAGRRFDGKPRELVARALQLDPTHWKALAMAGTDAFEQGQFKQAVIYWEQLRGQLPADSPISQSIAASITEARAKGKVSEAEVAINAPQKPAPATGMTAPADDLHKGVARKPADAADAKVAQADAGRSGSSDSGKAAAKAGAGVAVAGVVDLAPALKAKAGPDDAVFIFARPAQGARMPLAMTSVQVKDLPAKFKLDDSMAPTPNFKLSDQAEVVVTARISKSGQLMPQSGDLEGDSAAVKIGVNDVRVTIGKVRQ